MVNPEEMKKLPYKERLEEQKKKLPYKDKFVPKTEEEQTIERERTKSNHLRGMAALARLGGKK